MADATLVCTDSSDGFRPAGDGDAGLHHGGRPCPLHRLGVRHKHIFMSSVRHAEASAASFDDVVSVLRSAGEPTRLRILSLLAGEELSDDVLYEQPLMNEELEFQVNLLNQVSRPRDANEIGAIRQLAAQDGVSNLGITLSGD